MKSILANRHIPVDGACPVCHRGAEDLHHMLFQCDLAKSLWVGLGLSGCIDFAVQVDRSGSAILEFLLLESDQPLLMMPNLKEKEVIATGCWYLSWLRRRHTHHDSVPPNFRWHISILAIVNNYTNSVMQKRTLVEHRWKRPEPRFIKHNVDASFHADEGAGSVAGVLRDDRGNFIAGFCKFIPLAADVVTIEAMALRDGLFLANSLGFDGVEAESDSLNVINCC